MEKEITDLSIPIFSDDKIRQVNSMRKRPPVNWQSRRLYLGREGAKNWLNIVQHSNYPLHGEEDPYDLKKNRFSAIDMVFASTMVSLGPGNALSDIEIARQLRLKLSDFNYIPVDISSFLLNIAIQNLKDYVNIPAGFLCDFEQMPTLMKNKFAEIAERPILFSLLGGTVGNLDLGEVNFFKTIKSFMGKRDCLLIDVPLAGPAWTKDEDPRFKKTEYSDEFKRFLALGIAGWEQYIDDETLIRVVEQRIDCSASDRGDVPNTRIVTIIDCRTNRIILRFCRYDWDSIVYWLTERGFEIIFHRCSIDSSDDKFGMGVILIKNCSR